MVFAGRELATTQSYAWSVVGGFTKDVVVFNPFRTVAISKLLEVIGRSSFPHLVDRDRSPLGHKPDCRLG